MKGETGGIRLPKLGPLSLDPRSMSRLLVFPRSLSGSVSCLERYESDNAVRGRAEARNISMWMATAWCTLVGAQVVLVVRYRTCQQREVVERGEEKGE